MVFFSQAMTSLGGLILVAYTFKFAKMAEINQGTLTCIFSLTTFYVSLLFYFKFNEKVSAMKIIGMILMLPCIAFLALGSNTTADVTDTVTDPEAYTDQ